MFDVQDLEVPDAPRIKAIEEILSGKVCSELLARSCTVYSLCRSSHGDGKPILLSSPTV